MKLCKLHKGDKKGSIFLKKLYKAKFLKKNDGTQCHMFPLS